MDDPRLTLAIAQGEASGWLQEAINAVHAGPRENLPALRKDLAVAYAVLARLSAEPEAGAEEGEAA